MAMTLSLARRYARMSSRNMADSTMYSDETIDWGFQRAAAEFLRESRSTRTLGTVNLSSNTMIMPTMASDWSTDRQLQATLVKSGTLVSPNIEFVDYNTLMTALYAVGSSNAATQSSTVASIPTMPYPTMFAFRDASITSGLVFPPPSEDGYSIEYWYWKLFTQWTPGQAVLVANIGTANNIASVSVVSGGYYQGGAPTLTVSDSGSGSGATLTAVMTNNVVTSVTVNVQGSNYTGPTVLANGSTAANITFNILDEALEFIVSDGIQAYVQAIEPQNRQLAADAMERFQAATRRYAKRNAGGRGGDTWTATPGSSIQYFSVAARV